MVLDVGECLDTLATYVPRLAAASKNGIPMHRSPPDAELTRGRIRNIVAMRAPLSGLQTRGQVGVADIQAPQIRHISRVASSGKSLCICSR
jgi:hypothetical protein